MTKQTTIVVIGNLRVKHISMKPPAIAAFALKQRYVYFKFSKVDVLTQICRLFDYEMF